MFEIKSKHLLSKSLLNKVTTSSLFFLLFCLGKFPWKLLIYTGLLIFTTIQALNSTKMVSDYQQPLLTAFKKSLLVLESFRKISQILFRIKQNSISTRLFTHWMIFMNTWTALLMYISLQSGVFVLTNIIRPLKIWKTHFWV